MANEYKLSYTASEIDEKLGKIDTLLTSEDGNEFDERITALEQNGGGGGAQSDWNAKEGEAGHVLNRTHWSEQGEITLIDNMTLVEFDAYSSREFVLVEGQLYTVIVNGVESTMQATAYEADGVRGIAIGNPAGMGFEDDGLPYMICTIKKFDVPMTMIVSLTEETFTITLKTIGENVQRLPSKFIEGSIPYIIKYDGATITETPEYLRSVVLQNRPIILVNESVSDQEGFERIDFSFDAYIKNGAIEQYQFSHMLDNTVHKIHLIVNDEGGFDITLTETRLEIKS